MTDSVSTTPQPSTEPPPTSATASRGRPELLDQSKRRTVVALLANGSSRRIAARFVGCSPSTITRTASRDPEFAAEIAHAQYATQVRILQSLNNAASQERYWRAGAWLLERLNPDDFALRAPDTCTTEQLFQVVATMAKLIADELPEEYRLMVAAKLEGVLHEFAAHPKPSPAPAERPAAQSTSPHHPAGNPSMQSGRETGRDFPSAHGNARDFCNAPLSSDMELPSTANPVNATPKTSCG